MASFSKPFSAVAHGYRNDASVTTSLAGQDSEASPVGPTTHLINTRLGWCEKSFASADAWFARKSDSSALKLSGKSCDRSNWPNDYPPQRRSTASWLNMISSLTPRHPKFTFQRPTQKWGRRCRPWTGRVAICKRALRSMPFTRWIWKPATSIKRWRRISLAARFGPISPGLEKAWIPGIFADR